MEIVKVLEVSSAITNGDVLLLISADLLTPLPPELIRSIKYKIPSNYDNSTTILRHFARCIGKTQSRSRFRKNAFWHSSAHILAQAIISIYPKAKLTIGPAIENGFYYDIDFGDHSITDKELEEVEKKFLVFARQKFEFKMRNASKKEALDFYQKNENLTIYNLVKLYGKFEHIWKVNENLTKSANF